MTLSWGLGIAGLLLGRAGPHLGLGVLVGFVVVTPSLDWQLGLPNRSTAFVYLFGFLIGTWWHRTALAARERRSSATGELPRHATLAIRLSILTIAVSSLLALLRNVPLGDLAFQLRPAFAGLETFNPQSPAGPLQAALIATMGLLLLALSVGQLDEDALFYLCSRGIGADRARDLLTRGFVQEILDAIPVEGLRHGLGEVVQRSLRRIGESGA